MTDDLAKQAEFLFAQLERASKFGNRYNAFPYLEARKVLQGMQQIEASLPIISEPQTREQLFYSELKRKLVRECLQLENGLIGTATTFDFIINTYGISPEDIKSIRPWLDQNQVRTKEAIERLFQTKEVETYDLSLPLDIPRVRRQAEEIGQNIIEKYHKRVGRMLEGITNVAQFLRDINAVPTFEQRSYYHPLTKTLALSLSAFLYISEDGSILCRERELIRLYGHEGMGHALQAVVTKAGILPLYIKRDSGAYVATAAESIAQYYQQIIFEDIKDSLETQRELGLIHEFPTIYQEAKDSELLQKYSQLTFLYAITVLADKNFGEPEDKRTTQKKIDLINEVSINPRFARGFVESNRHSFDSEGNLNSNLIAELRYAAKPVERALQEFEKSGILYRGTGRDKIDQTLLNGFWTPEGLVDKARLVAEGKISI